jgi:hypothetical protein
MSDDRQPIKPAADEIEQRMVDEVWQWYQQWDMAWDALHAQGVVRDDSSHQHAVLTAAARNANLPGNQSDMRRFIMQSLDAVRAGCLTAESLALRERKRLAREKEPRPPLSTG